MYTKQLLWICLSFILIVFILALEAKFYERFSSIIYLVSLITLLGLYVFGNNVNGATSWYLIGPASIQPSEFAKAATALALAKYASDIQTNMNAFKDQLKAFFILALPAIFIIPQPDPGSALIYVAFIFPLYREGLHFVYLLLGFFCCRTICWNPRCGCPLDWAFSGSCFHWYLS
jgi:rod shape determining protein RodA